jgi:hypothetical protein
MWDDIAYVDTFSETWMHFNGECAIDMGLLDGIRTSSSYSQLGLVMHFLQNFLTWSIVKLMSLPVSMTNVVIDILFAVCTIVCLSTISGMFKNMSWLNVSAPCSQVW